MNIQFRMWDAIVRNFGSFYYDAVYTHMVDQLFDESYGRLREFNNEIQEAISQMARRKVSPAR